MPAKRTRTPPAETAHVMFSCTLSLLVMHTLSVFSFDVPAVVPSPVVNFPGQGCGVRSSDKQSARHNIKQ